MKTLARGILIACAFLELSDDTAVDPDAAVRAMEDIAAELQKAAPEERESLRSVAAEMAREERGAVKKFYESFVEHVGLHD